MEPSHRGRSRDGVAVGNGADLDVVLGHALDPGLVEVVGVGGVADLPDRFAGLDRRRIGSGEQQRGHGVLDHHRVDVPGGVPERIDVVERDRTRVGEVGQARHVPQRPRRADELGGVGGVEVQLVTQPVLHARAALALVVLVLGDLRDQVDLLRVDRVLQALQQPQRIRGRRVGVEDVGGCPEALREVL
jgi:hypothetical protein